MRDILHTNEQRIVKLRGLIQGVRGLGEHGTPSENQIESLKVLANEAESSLDALEFFLAERRALQKIDD